MLIKKSLFALQRMSLLVISTEFKSLLGQPGTLPRSLWRKHGKKSLVIPVAINNIDLSFLVLFYHLLHLSLITATNGKIKFFTKIYQHYCILYTHGNLIYIRDGDLMERMLRWLLLLSHFNFTNVSSRGQMTTLAAISQGTFNWGCNLSCRG